ncbi:unnamed protein product [Nesidiocoris tenuis]|uniref:Uncharacterized protein n=1 Tax=Nesidiocoris tenuis TaxID=355587 RepID=A0A6H5FVJ2_9HEMI|nr:unnamed protein product [Nesidiocoris tenuis]
MCPRPKRRRRRKGRARRIVTDSRTLGRRRCRLHARLHAHLRIRTNTEADTDPSVGAGILGRRGELCRGSRPLNKAIATVRPAHTVRYPGMQDPGYAGRAARLHIDAAIVNNRL